MGGDITTFAGRDGDYAVIACFETIEHVPDYRASLENVARLLAPGATLLVSSPYRPLTTPRTLSLHDLARNSFHVREFLPEELNYALRSVGLEVEPVLYGQGVQPMLLPKLAQLVYNRIVMPRTSSYVRPVESGHPRYFCLRASRPRSGA